MDCTVRLPGPTGREWRDIQFKSSSLRPLAKEYLAAPGVFTAVTASCARDASSHEAITRGLGRSAELAAALFARAISFFVGKLTAAYKPSTIVQYFSRHGTRRADANAHSSRVTTVLSNALSRFMVVRGAESSLEELTLIRGKIPKTGAPRLVADALLKLAPANKSALPADASGPGASVGAIAPQKVAVKRARAAASAVADEDEDEDASEGEGRGADESDNGASSGGASNDRGLKRGDGVTSESAGSSDSRATGGSRGSKRSSRSAQPLTAEALEMNSRRERFFKGLDSVVFRDTALSTRTGELVFTDGIAASLGFCGSKHATAVDKTCLLGHVVDPGLVPWFNETTALISRFRKWGATLGDAAIKRAFFNDPTGNSLPMIDANFWRHACKVGGYTSKTEFEAILVETFKAPAYDGGFAGAPLRGTPLWDQSVDERRNVLFGLAPQVKYAMEEYDTAYQMNLWDNFPSRQRASVVWWCETHLPFVRAKVDLRVAAITAAINGEKTTTTPPAAAASYIKAMREQLFGAGNDKYKVKPADASKESWRKKHMMRMLIASAHLNTAAGKSWAEEAAAGRVKAWRDTAALRAVGGSAERFGAMREEEGVDANAPDVKADEAALQLAEAAVTAMREAAVAEYLAAASPTGANADAGPSWQAPRPGKVPPKPFALTPEVKFARIHVRFDREGMMQKLGYKNVDDVHMAEILLPGNRDSPLGASFTTNGVVLCRSYNTTPEDYGVRAVLGVRDPAFTKADKAKGRAVKAANQPPKARKRRNARKATAKAGKTYLGTLSRSTLDKICRWLVARNEGADKALLHERLQEAMTTAGRNTSTLIKADVATSLALFNLEQKDISTFFTEAETLVAAGDAGDPAAGAAPRPKKRVKAAAPEDSEDDDEEKSMSSSSVDDEEAGEAADGAAGPEEGDADVHDEAGAAPPNRRMPGRAVRRARRGVAPVRELPSQHFPHCACGSPECPTRVKRPSWSAQFGHAVGCDLPHEDKRYTGEDGMRLLGVDTGQGNGVSIADVVRIGEGNRLGHGPRCNGKSKADVKQRQRREAERRKPDGHRHPRGERVATYVLHQGHLDRASGRLKNLALSAIWLREVAAEHALLGTVTRKTMRIDELAAYHAVLNDVAEACWENGLKPRRARQAFGVWSRLTAAIDTFWATVLRGRKCDGTTGFDGSRRDYFSVLAYGDGKWGGGRSPQKAIRQGAERAFSRKRVLTTHEFDTTKTCHVCGDVLQGVVDRQKNLRLGFHAGALDRGIKHCANSFCSTYLDRDVNAALNILHAKLATLRGEQRPPHLRQDYALRYPNPENHSLLRRSGTSSVPSGSSKTQPTSGTASDARPRNQRVL